MKRFKRIVAATDLTAESLSTVAFAAHLARAHDARLLVLHVPTSTAAVYSEFLPPLDIAGIDDVVEASAREHLERWARSNLRGQSGVTLQVRSGHPSDTITKVATEWNADLIVMATHGRKGLGYLALGSVTEQVLRDARSPVMTVNPWARKREVTARKQSLASRGG
jgi:nucleotide-binding universal stress UspA family protein